MAPTWIRSSLSWSPTSLKRVIKWLIYTLLVQVMGLVQLTAASSSLSVGEHQKLSHLVTDQVETVNNNSQVEGASSQPVYKFPLYMRIIATLACLVIFTVGVCGNLLVPLVVVKTKYLRNSTNLFLINLSVADLLVLAVCMPTTMIELHSRPETWLLGEPMCKLSNFVEMLAANGSIFTILAISFERYYAICKPLKAGYKCTRLRATIIICIIWLLSSLLTSPILMMAKSNETIYLDGSLVYNCILETGSYWAKMYVFVSMFAFFCLPLLVLMFVYWLISRRLIRENLAMSATTSLAASDPSDTTMSKNDADGSRQMGQLARKAASLRSVSRFFSSLHQHHYYHHFSLSKSISNGNKRAANLGSLITPSTEPFEANKRRRLKQSKALSLDRHFMHNAAESSLPTLRINDPISSASINQSSQLQSDSHSCLHRSANEQISSRFVLANQIIRKLFRFSSTSCQPNQEVDMNRMPSKCERGNDGERPPLHHQSSRRRQSGWTQGKMLPINELMGSPEPSSQLTNAAEFSSQQDPQAPFLPSVSSNSNTGINDRTGAGYRGRQLKKHCVNISNNLLAKEAAKLGTRRHQGSKFSWAKSFSMSSSLGGSSEQATTCTILPGSSSISYETSSMAGAIDLELSSAQAQDSSAQPMIHNSCIECAGSEQQRDLVQKQQGAKKKIAHFDDSSKLSERTSHLIPTSSASSASSPTNTSVTGSSSSAYSSKSPSPELNVADQHKTLQSLSPAPKRAITCVVNARTCPRQSDCNGQTRPTVVRHAQITRNDTKQTLVSESDSENDNEDQINKMNPEKSKFCDTNIEVSGALQTRVKLTKERRSSSVAVCTGEADADLSRTLDQASNNHQCHFYLNLKRQKRPYGSSGTNSRGAKLSELLVVQDLSKKQQMESRRQVVIMLAFVVACFFLLFFPYRVFTIWLILSTEDQVQSLGMETYYNLTYFSRILIYLHSAINPIAYNLISTKFRRAFMSILLCRGSSSRRHFTTGRRITAKKPNTNCNHDDHKKPIEQTH